MYNFLESTFGCVCRFGIYSDLLGYAKPNEAFFNEIIRSRGVAADDILHVGDDAICDCKERVALECAATWWEDLRTFKRLFMTQFEEFQSKMHPY
ncbi:hypothetical protein ACCT03_36760 [Rhizobium johnstonii]|uniref:hypothetical protein n=1 Tax=Rhizobium TaxID=379 RepID=UPI001031553B|nr:hypothetical protein [Rhizobium leguminosarum]WSH10878.1 hypothetical protein U8P72_27425 [Rhizobium johnstonii]TBF22460.1 hypothetical protein ELG92_36215 [Rhizobium leguminosarum]TBF64415.1 hypothetical protein ELG89_36090 [Rhizobium leguminosarum]TBF65939.1 hypothetical protein ELG86_39030 [Rhizobium leguminosarum]TBG32235.1 hypothetical protein ELG77_25645 [Rhizobium leguminosarum]